MLKLWLLMLILGFFILSGPLKITIHVFIYLYFRLGKTKGLSGIEMKTWIFLKYISVRNVYGNQIFECLTGIENKHSNKGRGALGTWAGSQFSIFAVETILFNWIIAEIGAVGQNCRDFLKKRIFLPHSKVVF